MKKTLIIIIFLLSFSNNAQTIKSIYDDGLYFEPGMYYKDVHNDMDRFLGTWVYENGNRKLTIVLQKRLHTYIEPPFDCYVDEVIGGYKYEIDNNVNVNTIPDIDFSKPRHGNTISGSGIVSNQYPPVCTNCPINDKRLDIHWKEPLAPYLVEHLMIRYFEEFNQSYIEVKVYDEMSYIPENATIETTRLPLGTYIMEKQ